MHRRSFIEKMGLLGLGLPAISSCQSLNQQTESPINKVIIVGAGAAGLTAGHLLTQSGIEVQILEASSSIGGRMKRTLDFADFPVPLGAEWLHTDKKIFTKIVNDPSTGTGITTQPYNFDQDRAIVNGEEVGLKYLGFTIDQKFIGTSWYDFYDRYIVPSISNKIQLGSVVDKIDFSSSQVQISTKEDTYHADAVIVTIPAVLLKKGNIDFTPALPQKKLKALDQIKTWGGCKAFISFKESFYPTVTGFDIDMKDEGHKLFYDASYGQKTSQNILGVFAVGPCSKKYTSLKKDSFKEVILEEIANVYEREVKDLYIDHVFQDWTHEPFAQGATFIIIKTGTIFEDLEKQFIKRSSLPAMPTRMVVNGPAYMPRPNLLSM